MSTEFSAAALKLILDAEGLDQPSRWPEGASGITIGRGDDLGYQSAAEFAENWQPHLAHEDYVLLLDAIGFKGEHAHAIAHRFAGIHITAAQADAVFQGKVLPHYIELTARAFPGFERLPLDARGALVSLVYNRGEGFGKPSDPGYPKSDSRYEMRAIRDEVAKNYPSLSTIAAFIRSMKRLWEGKHEDGLLTRRDAEADLVEHAV